MKKVMNKINFAIIAIMASAPAFADPMCDLIKQLQSVFKFIRTMAFVGAAFFIAGWAWSFIVNAGDKDKGGSIEDLRKKSISLIIGFALLFMIGLVLSFIMSTPGLNAIGCKEILTTGW